MRKETVLNKIRNGFSDSPTWIIDNLQYLTLMGSHAYHINTEDSDWDIYGFCVPPIQYIYPKKLIHGYDEIPKFEQAQFQFKEGKKSEHLDVTIYNITKYFKLVFDNNPNMIDSLFTTQNCVLFETPIAKRVREHKQLFLHKGAFHKFKGYAYSQLSKIRTDPKNRKSPERKAIIEKYGFDIKYALHLFRLLDECEQILTTGTIILGRNNEELKLVRKGFFTLQEIEEKFKAKEVQLERLYNESLLPWGKDAYAPVIRNLLDSCLYEFYFGKNAIDETESLP